MCWEKPEAANRVYNSASSIARLLATAVDEKDAVAVKKLRARY